jgi:DNA-binding CsgD family transcriptional regulator
VAAAVSIGLALHKDNPDWTRVFDVLTSVVPAARAVQVSSWQPQVGKFSVVAEHGYPPAVSADLVRMDRTRWGRNLISAPGPLLMDDPGGAFRESPHYNDWLAPSGFDDGLSARLRTEDGRTAGLIHMSADKREAFGEEERHFVAEVGRALAARLIASAPVDDPELAGVIRGFNVRDWPSLAFLWQWDGAWHQVVLTKNSPVRITPFNNAKGLSTRELQVLTGIADGLRNQELAERLVIGRRTVETYVERLLAKLDCRTRSDLAVTAVRSGLLLPEAASLEAVRISTDPP